MLIIFFQPLWALAAVRCDNLFRPTTTEPVGLSQIYDPFVRPYNNRLYPLDGYVQTEYLQSTGGARFVQLLPYQDYLSGMRFGLPTMALHDQGLGTVYSFYGARMSPKILDEIKQIEKYLPVSRQASFTVFSDERPGEVVGFFRIFDGGMYPGNGPLAHNKFYSDPSLPLERIAALNGRKIKAVEKDRADKKSIYELGKYFISKSVTVETRMKIKKLILKKWLVDQIIAPEEEEHTVFYVDVATEVHRRAYEREFGCTVIDDPEMNGGAVPPEYIMRVDMKTLREKINAGF
jgi:hypothetical protein